jgi:hypothetical protein
MKLKKLVVAMALVLPAAGVMACASCGCSLNTDIGTQGMGMTEGWTLDVRYDTLNQNKLRYGTKSISQSQAAATINSKTGEPAEVENYTQNNYVTASLDYNDGESWGVTASLPYIMRNHSTFGNYGDEASGAELPAPGYGAYSSKSAGIGDMKIIGRYFGFAEQKDWGFQFGVKLPTGSRNQTGTLSNGGGSVLIDPGLQAGTGSTDLIAGIYKFGYINDSDDWGYFAQAQYQAAVMVQSVPANAPSPDGSYGGTYRPGNAANVNIGINYQGFEKWVPTLQLNLLNKTADSGTAADTWATGGTLAYLTPGVLYRLTEKTQVYANVQLPVYQNVNGIQLVPSYIASMGVRVHF